MIDDPKATLDPNPPRAAPPIPGSAVVGRGEERADPAPPPLIIFPEAEAELRRFVWGVLRNTAQVDDVIQATYLKAMERGSAAQPATAKGWLFRVAYHEALVVKRREASRDRTTQRLAALPPREAVRPDEALIRQETIQTVRQALTTLSAAQLRVVTARMNGNQTFAQIAADSGLPLGTVLTHMRRALDKMRRVLDPGE